ncbi:hypothetical protein GN956_G23201 [Arapaima gigas]
MCVSPCVCNPILFQLALRKSDDVIKQPLAQPRRIARRVLHLPKHEQGLHRHVGCQLKRPRGSAQLLSPKKQLGIGGALLRRPSSDTRARRRSRKVVGKWRLCSGRMNRASNAGGTSSSVSRSRWQIFTEF